MSENIASPGSSARVRGRDLSEPLNPGDGENEAEVDVKTVCRSCGFESEAYWPGSKRTSVGMPGTDIVAPTDVRVSVVLVN